MNTVDAGSYELEQSPLITSATSANALERLVASGRLFAAFGGSKAPEVAEKAREFGPRIGVCLYRPQDDDDLAPYLFHATSELHPWVRAMNHEDPTACIFALADTNLEGMRRHFRRLLVQSPALTKMNFFDPRVLVTWLDCCTPQELDDFFGPVSEYGIPTEDGLGALFWKRRVEGAMRRRKDVLPKLRLPQMRTFTQASEAVAAEAQKIDTSAVDEARKIAGRTLEAVCEVFGQPKAQAERLAMRRELIGFRPPTPHERLIAARPGNAVEQINARHKVALEFYKTMGRTWDRQNLELREYVLPTELRSIFSHLAGIDFNQPISVGPPPPAPTTVAQWRVPGGNKGQYFTPPKTTPLALGIGALGTQGDKLVPKISTNYAIPGDTPYLTTTASAKLDTWSAKGMPQKTKGGAVQYYMGDNSQLQVIGPTPKSA